MMESPLSSILLSGFVFISFYLVVRATLRAGRAGELLGNSQSPPPWALPPVQGSLLLFGTLLLILSQSFFFYLIAPLVILAAGENGHRFGWNRLRPGSLLVRALLICGAFLVILAPLTALSQWALHHFHWPDQEQEAVQLFRNLKKPSDILIFLAQAVLLAPFMEELFFRGFLFPFLKTYLRTGFAIILSAAVFALVHLNLASFLPLWAFGIVLALTYESTGSLPLCMAIHGLFNLGTALTLLGEKS